jgi:bifunctional non-homologous end joining protein LigD
VRLHSDIFTEHFAKLGRERKILDYLRNHRTNTSIAAYSTRAKPDAPVSTPIAWSCRHRDGRIGSRCGLPARLRALRADPWREYHSNAQRLPRGAAAALDRL